MYLEVDSRIVARLAGDPVERVHLAHQVTLPDAAKRRVARHLAWKEANQRDASVKLSQCEHEYMRRLLTTVNNAT